MKKAVNEFEVLEQFCVVAFAVRRKISDTVASLLREDANMTVWWGTWVECMVAISRLKGENKSTETGEEEAHTNLDGLSTDLVEIEPTNEPRLLAMPVSKVYPLKAADCFQPAAALCWCEGNTDDADSVCLDNRPRHAAEDEGFDVSPKGIQL